MRAGGTVGGLPYLTRSKWVFARCVPKSHCALPETRENEIFSHVHKVGVLDLICKAGLISAIPVTPIASSRPV